MIARIVKFTSAAIIAFCMGFIATVITQALLETQVSDESVLVPYQSIKTNGTNLYSGIIKLAVGDKGFCSAVVIDGTYALTAAHCVKNSLGMLSSDTIVILDTNDVYTNTTAKAVALDNSRDIALITGDFANFSYYDVADSPAQGLVIACGFPSGGALFCNMFRLNGNVEFRLYGTGGILYKGMSGGPVFDADNKVVAVNSAVADQGVVFGPVTGALEIFGIK